MRRKAKVDANQENIVSSLRKIPGLKVRVTSQVGEGFPDIIIGYKKRNWLIELKDGNKPKSAQKLTPAQVQFMEEWQGQVDVCNCLDDVLKLIMSN